MNPFFRLIVDEPRAAALNMAVDEMLMVRQRRAGADPCLRFYRWQRPAVTCGYFQDVRSVGARFQDRETVRRITGGGLVTHGDDLTFSLTLRDDHPFFDGPVKDSYLKVSEALRIGLSPHYAGLDYADCRNTLSPRGRGERVCFEQPACYDLLLAGKKVAGSSQRHSEGAVLYQSSVFLPGGWRTVLDRILEGFRRSWKAEFQVRALDADELAEAARIEVERYRSEGWRFLPASLASKHSGQL